MLSQVWILGGKSDVNLHSMPALAVSYGNEGERG